MSLFKPSTSHLTAMKEATDGVAGIIRAQGAAGRLYALLETRPKMERGEGSRKGGREGMHSLGRNKGVSICICIISFALLPLYNSLPSTHRNLHSSCGSDTRKDSIQGRDVRLSDKAAT